jgi:hypothetical protein
MAQTHEYQVINAPAANISADLDRYVVAGWRPIFMNTITLSCAASAYRALRLRFGVGLLSTV